MPIQDRPNLLIVDDLYSEIRILYEALSEDYAVRFASNGEECLEMLGRFLPDLLLLDVMMPGMDGHEVLRAIRSQPRTRDLSVIFITADCSVQAQLQSLDEGVDDFITKPVILPILLARVRNLLERQRLRQQRQDSEEWYRAIFASAHDAILIMPLDPRNGFPLNFIDANPRACQLFGYAPNVLQQKSLWDLLHADEVTSIPALALRLQAEGFIAATELLHQRADGSTFWAQLHVSLLTMNGGSYAMAMLQDISERKAMETAREQARLEAERLARAKGDFLANMSHEIRTPLNAVLGFAQVGRLEVVEARGHELFARILDSGKLLLGVVNDILDFAKIEAGKLRLDLAWIDVREIVEQALGLLADRAAAKGVGIRLQLDTLELPCWGDSLRLSQVLANLLSNAIKFTAQGEVMVRVQRLGDDLCLEVRDTGIGMKAEQLERLFQPFEQADSTTTRHFGGTGLGLAISRRLIELMGGTIQVESVWEQGTRFLVRIPARWGRVMSKAAVAEKPVLFTGRGRLRGLRVLAAEDHVVNQLVLEELLRPEEAELVIVDDGQQAVDQVRLDGSKAFDLVLMDVQMPVLDGYGATRRLVEMAPELPVLGLTAHALPSERQRCLDAGMIGLLTKPVDLDDLVAAIVAGVRRRRHDPQLAASSSGPAASRVENASGEAGHHIDWVRLQTRYRGSAAFIEKLLGSVLHTHRDMPQRLREVVQAGDHELQRQLAHSVKGIAGHICAVSLQQLAAEAEAGAAQGGDGTLVLNLATHLEACLEDIVRSGIPAPAPAASDGKGE